MLTGLGFTGPLTGNADTATNSTTITVSDTTDTSCSVALFESGTGSLAPKTDGSLTYNATTGMLTGSGFNSNNQRIINVGEPLHPNDATSKTYVDSIAEGLHILEPCLVSSFNNFTGTYTHNADGYNATSTLEIDFSTSQKIGNGAVSNNTTLKTGISSHQNLVDLSGDFSITNSVPPPSNGTYVNLPSTSSEHGIGARFNITVVGGNITNLTCIVSGNRYSTSDTITIVVDSKNITLDFSNSNGLVYQIDGLEIVDASDTDYSDVEHVVKYSSILITGVTEANPGVVTTASTHNFTTGDEITIQNVSGMTQVNNKKFTITVISPTTFSIGVDTSLYNTWTSAGSVSKESITTRIFIKNQTNLNENGIYYISQYSSDTYTFTRSDDFNSMYKEGSNDDGDIRPGDYAYISDGIHDANKNHAFVLANEHMNVNGSYVWDGTQTSSHIDPDAILVVAFTGAETIHIDDVSIELDGVERHLQVKDNGISFSKLNDSLIVTEAEGISSNDNDITFPTSAAIKDYVDSNTSSQISITTNNTGTTLYPVFVSGTGDQDANTDTDLQYNASTNTLNTNLSGFTSLQSFHSSSSVIYTVTVDSKDNTHRYNGQGSSSGYKINGRFSPFLTLTPGTIYRFDLSDASTSGHPFKFYTSVLNSSTEITNGVTVNGSQGSSGAYVQLIIDDDTPNIIYYQCSAHGYMGNAIQTNSNRATTATNVTVADESTDTNCNVLFTTVATGDLSPKSGTNLTFNSNTGVLTTTGFSGDLTGDVSLGNGSAAAPSLHFESDVNTGVYRRQEDCLGFSTAGVERFWISNGGTSVFYGDIVAASGEIRISNGTASVPAFSFDSDSNTGIYRVSDGNLGITSNGTQKLFVNSTGLNITSGDIVHTPSTITPDSTNDKVLYWDATDNTFKKSNFSDVCFLEGTKFTLADKSQKNIEDLTLEDIILTYNIQDLSNLKDKNIISTWKQKEMEGKFSQSEIRNIWVNPIDKYIIINEKLHITNYHIIHIRRDDEYLFIFAENVKVGDELLNSNENYEKVFDIQQVHKSINVYNFELLKDMTSFADNYLVHNFCESCSGMSEFI